MRTWTVSIILVLASALILGGATATAGAPRVVLCHDPDARSFHTIAVDGDAVDAHLTHGDLPGACETTAEERCDDGNPCTVDAFLPGTVLCDPTPDLLDCDDRILCTDDVCDPERGCVSTVACGSESPVCDPGATEIEEACTGVAGECPLDLIAATNGLGLRPVTSTECVRIVGFGTFTVDRRDTSDLCGQGTQDADCCEEACDCTCGGPLTVIAEDVEGEARDRTVRRVTLFVEEPGGSSRGFGFVQMDDGSFDLTCPGLFASPGAAASCLEGICTDP